MAGLRGGARALRPRQCDVWVELAFGDTCAATITEDLATFGITPIRSEQALREAGARPPWAVDGDPALESHRSALVRKDPELYGPLFPDVPYVWPGGWRTSRQGGRLCTVVGAQLST